MIYFVDEYVYRIGKKYYTYHRYDTWLDIIFGPDMIFVHFNKIIGDDMINIYFKIYMCDGSNIKHILPTVLRNMKPCSELANFQKLLIENHSKKIYKPILKDILFNIFVSAVNNGTHMDPERLLRLIYEMDDKLIDKYITSMDNPKINNVNVQNIYRDIMNSIKPKDVSKSEIVNIFVAYIKIIFHLFDMNINYNIIVDVLYNIGLTTETKLLAFMLCVYYNEYDYSTDEKELFDNSLKKYMHNKIMLYVNIFRKKHKNKKIIK
jgi:hypothetical protein